MLGTEVFHKIYTMLDKVNPVSYDCGESCGSVCCQKESFKGDTEPYLYLLPGEKEYLESAGSDIRIVRERGEEHDLPGSFGEYVYVAYCKGPDKCDRRLRPIQCRTFPLVPRITQGGELLLTRYDDELPYQCPLIEEKLELSEAFINATYEAWEILAEDKAIRDLIRMDTENEVFGEE